MAKFESADFGSNNGILKFFSPFQPAIEGSDLSQN
jgi:hypothetical protein